MPASQAADRLKASNERQWPKVDCGGFKVLPDMLGHMLIDVVPLPLAVAFELYVLGTSRSPIQHQEASGFKTTGYLRIHSLIREATECYKMSENISSLLCMRLVVELQTAIHDSEVLAVPP